MPARTRMARTSWNVLETSAAKSSASWPSETRDGAAAEEDADAVGDARGAGCRAAEDVRGPAEGDRPGGGPLDAGSGSTGDVRGILCGREGPRLQVAAIESPHRDQDAPEGDPVAPAGGERRRKDRGACD